MASALTDIESEVVLLKAVTEIIDSIVNFEMLELTGQDPNTVIVFPSSTHQKLFSVLLVDFLSVTDRQAPISQTSYLGGLRSIAGRPAFDFRSTIEPLRAATAEFVRWLEEEVEVGIWLPSMSVETNLKLSRLAFIKMCGHISKHNFLRAIGVVHELRDALARSGVAVSVEDALAAMPDFYERFHTDILNYHSSTIAEFLNNIRWAIHEYLQPELHRSFIRVVGDPPTYRYAYPDKVKAQFARDCYWNLMNEVKQPPYV